MTMYIPTMCEICENTAIKKITTTVVQDKSSMQIMISVDFVFFDKFVYSTIYCSSFRLVESVNISIDTLS